MTDWSLESGLRYKDKVVIVTGGCSGIGKGIVDVFTAHGGKVAIFDVNDEKGKKLSGKPGDGEVFYIHCDTSNEEHVKEAIQKTVDKFGQIHCLVNNAGVYPPELTIDNFTADDFRQVLEVNLVGYFLCCKGGVSALARCLAVDEAKYGVRVNSVSPGATDTPMLRRFVDPSTDKELNKRIVLGRICEPKEIGYACLFLATDATYCTAIDIFASGGGEMGCWK